MVNGLLEARATSYGVTVLTPAATVDWDWFGDGTTASLSLDQNTVLTVTNDVLGHIGNLLVTSNNFSLTFDSVEMIAVSETVGEVRFRFWQDSSSVTAEKLGVGAGSGDMTAAVYDPAGINEQLVGLVATQTLTNKTIAFGSNTVSGTMAEFDVSCTDGAFMYTGDPPTAHTHTEGDISDLGTTVAMVADNLSVFAATTKAQFDTLCSDGDFLYVGDPPTVHTHNQPITIYAVDWSTDLTVVDGVIYFRVTADLDGLDIIGVGAQLGAAQSTSGTPTVQITRGRFATPGGARTWTDVLSTLLTIDANEWDSKDATSAAVINTAADDVAEGDMIRVDVDVTGTGAQGLFVTLEFG